MDSMSCCTSAGVQLRFFSCGMKVQKTHWKWVWKLILSVGPSLVAAYIVCDIMSTSQSGFFLKAGLKTQFNFLNTVLAFCGMERM